jgi:hypothetical protein
MLKTLFMEVVLNRGIVFSVLFLAGALLSAHHSLAYDDLITNDAHSLIADGGVSLGASLLYTTAGKSYDSGGNSADLAKDIAQMRIPLRASYGFSDKINAFIMIPVVVCDDRANRETGVGDLWLGAKYTLLPENLLTFRGALALAMDDDNAKGPGSPGGPGIDVAIMGMKQTGMYGINAQAGIRLNSEDEDKFAPGLSFYAMAEGSHSLTEAIRGIAGIEFKTAGDGKNDGADAKTATSYLDLRLGAEYQLAGKTGLRGDIMYTLMGKRDLQNLGILIRFGYLVR